MSNTEHIQQDSIYHIYNRAVGNDSLYRCHQDYVKFLHYVKKFILPVAEIYAYCLLPNHFHFMLRVKSEPRHFSKSIGDALNGYARRYNGVYGRMGTLFMRPFKRKLIEDDNAITWLCWYIHRNPIHHGYVEDWRDWRFSSYEAYTASRKTVLKVDFLLEHFGSRQALLEHHEVNSEDWKEEEMM